MWALLFSLAAATSIGRGSAFAFDSATFDHNRTGFPLTGAHERTDCETCHQGGRFKGTPRQCLYCHGGAGSEAFTRRPPNHIPSSSRCDDCHTTFTWRDARFDHFGAPNQCISCHNRSLASGKTPNHLPTSNNCDDCHSVMVWSAAVMDHVGIVSNCLQCHNGSQASGKSPRHLPTTNLCEDCHLTATWNNSSKFDHAQALGTCEGCHNNSLVAGKPADHIPTTLPCDTCHSTHAWVPLKF